MYRFTKYLAIFILSLPVVPHALAQSQVLNVGGIEVTQEDIERYIIENIPAEKREAILERDGIFQEMAESIYIMRSLAAEAEAQPGFDKTQAAWAAKMKYQRRVVSEYRIDYVRATLGDVNWEAAARESYIVDPERYSTKEKIRASHILISTEERSDEEAKQLATEIRTRIIDGEDFAVLATEFTDDPAGKKNGGELGFFERGRMVKPFEDAAFAMKEEGDISELVKSPFGYHIIRFTGRRPGAPIPFEDVKEKIIDEIQTQRGNQIWQDKIIAARSAAKQTLNEELLQETRSKYRGTEPSE